MTIRRWILVAVVAIAVVAATAVARLFVWPRTDVPGHADAVIVLGHGLSGERLPEALKLMSQRVAPVLVVSEARDPGSPSSGRFCRTRRSFEVLCFRATPFTTRGEAREVARLAAVHGWRSLVLVTSTFHVTRARLLYERCFPGRVDAVGATPRAGFLEELGATVHEGGALVYALLVARDC